MTLDNSTARPTCEEIIAHAKAHGLAVLPDGDAAGFSRGGAWMAVCQDPDGDPIIESVELGDRDGHTWWNDLGVEANGGIGFPEHLEDRDRCTPWRWYPLDWFGTRVSRYGAADVLRRAGALYVRLAERPLLDVPGVDGADEARVTAAAAVLARAVAAAAGRRDAAAEFAALSDALAGAAMALRATAPNRLYDGCDGADFELAREASRLAAEAFEANLRYVELAVIDDLDANRAPGEEAAKP